MRKEVHISIDDFYVALLDLNCRQYDSLWQQPKFRYLFWLHKIFGVKITLNTFEKEGDYNITKITNKFKAEFTKASDWLKLTFHAIDAHDPRNDSLDVDNFSKSFQRVQEAIVSFAGEHSLGHVYRLHYWYYPQLYVNVMANAGGGRLVLPFANATSPQNMEFWYNTLCLDKDRYWIKKINNNETLQPIVIFTHEWALNRKMKIRFALFIAWLSIHGYDYICK